MLTKVCDKCKFYEPEIEPDGHGNGMGFCMSLVTKQVGGEFQTPIGEVACSAPPCSQFLPAQTPEWESEKVEALLTPPRMPHGVLLERAIEIQAGKCLRQQDAIAAESGGSPLALNRDQQRFCKIQITAALANPRFFGRILLFFGGKDGRSLLGFKVKLFPPGGEIRT